MAVGPEVLLEPLLQQLGRHHQVVLVVLTAVEGPKVTLLHAQTIAMVQMVVAAQFVLFGVNAVCVALLHSHQLMWGHNGTLHSNS